MGTPRSRKSARRATSSLTTAGLLGALLLSGCIDPATSESTETTLVPLVAPAFVTLAPASSTTVASGATTTTAPPNVNTGGTAATTQPGSSDPGSATTTASPSGSTTAKGTYTVAANDTVYGIARKHGITADALATLNGWSDGAAHGIFPGDAVKVPEATTSTTAATPATTTTAASGTPATTSVAVGDGGTYVIKANDYLALIAKNTGTTVDGIVTVNGWSDGVDHLLIPGDTIKLPGESG